MNWLIKNFLRGLVIVVPIALTIYLLYEAFVRIDRLLNLKTPGAGFAITIVAIIAIGAVASNFFVRKFLRLTETMFTRAPLVRLIYASIKDLLEAFVGDKKRFDQPVAVTITDGRADARLRHAGRPRVPRACRDRSRSTCRSRTAWPGRWSSWRGERVEALAVDSASVMALVVSGGVSRGARARQV